MKNPTSQKTSDDPLAFERDYKYKIVDLLARAMHPGYWDAKEKLSDGARVTLQAMARKCAIECLKVLAPYIKEPH